MKRYAALFLSVVIAIALFAGCGNTETAGSPASETQAVAAAQNGSGTTAAPAPAAADEDDEEEGFTAADELYNVDWEDMAEIRMVSMATGPIPVGVQEVEDAINAITEPEINVHVKYEMIDVGSYIQQLSLMMSSAEPVDIVLTIPAAAAEVSSMRAAGQLMDITDYVEKYGQGLKNVIGDYFAATTFEGKIFSVPILRDYVTSVHVMMRTDVLEDLGLVEQAENIKTMADYEAILKAVKESEKWNYLVGIASEMGNGAVIENSHQYVPNVAGEETTYFDVLTSDFLAVDPTGENPEIQILFGTDVFRERIDLGVDWYNKGYVYKDGATDTTTARELIKADKLFSSLKAGEYGIEARTTSECEMPMTVVKLCTIPISTGTVTKFTWAIPNSATSPEAAVTFLSMLYNDARLNNLLAYGIEGRDYVVEDGVAVYPNGDENVPYHGASFIVGNQFLTLPWDGEPANIREESYEIMKDAIVSKYLGFSFDTSNIETEIASVTAVVQQYSTLLPSGLATQETVDEFLTKLNAAQVDVVLQAAQDQLYAWIAANQ